MVRRGTYRNTQHRYARFQRSCLSEMISAQAAFSCMDWEERCGQWWNTGSLRGSCAV